MLCTNPVLSHQTVTSPRLAAEPEYRLPRQAHPDEYPLLAWVAGELQTADGLDDRGAVRAAHRLLEQAFTQVEPFTTTFTPTETLQ